MICQQVRQHYARRRYVFVTFSVKNVQEAARIQNMRAQRDGYVQREVMVRMIGRDAGMVRARGADTPPVTALRTRTLRARRERTFAEDHARSVTESRHARARVTLREMICRVGCR